MRTENGITYIKVGGKEVEAIVLFKDVEKFLKDFYKIVRRNRFKKTEKLQIPNEFFFDVFWKCLVKDGYLWWKKPFRSKSQMINSIRYDEIENIVSFISKHILKFEETAAAPNKKKEKKKTQPKMKVTKK